MTISRRWWAALALVGLQGLAHADYPERDVSVIVPYGAGGATDVIVRTLAQRMQKTFPKALVVVNRTGGQATIGPAYVSKARPDGYTLGVVTYSGIAITPHLLKVPYTADDFDYIGAFARYQFGLAVRADAPYKNLDEFVEYAKRSPKPVFFGSGGAPNNLAFFALGRASGAKFEEVTYKGGAESVNALLGRQVEAIIQAPSEILPHVQSGQLRLLASASPARWKDHNEVPTFKDAGYDVAIDSWVGFIVPKGTPAAIRSELEKATKAAIEDTEVKATLQKLGVDAGWMPGAQFKSTLLELYRTMPGQLRDAGMQLAP